MGRIMLKKLLVAASAAAALSVPLAGVAWADQPTDPGVGSGGVPGKIGQQPPGKAFAPLREIAKASGQSTPQLLREISEGQTKSQGDAISDVTHGNFG
jgi:hypothetical protein